MKRNFFSIASLKPHDVLSDILNVETENAIESNYQIESKFFSRSVKLATSSQLLVAGYLFLEKLATSIQLLVTGKSKLLVASYIKITGSYIVNIMHTRLYQIWVDIMLNLAGYLYLLSINILWGGGGGFKILGYKMGGGGFFFLWKKSFNKN